MALRFDSGKINNWQKLDDGRLRVEATFSRTGKLLYGLPNGETQEETVTADELFDDDSLDTAATAYVTLGHPPVFVTDSNWKDYSIGFTGTKVVKRVDEGLVDIVFAVVDREGKKAIEEDGLREVSAGYTTEHKADGGRILQTKRRYNHFALVPEGRAGKKVALHMDSNEEFAVQVINQRTNIKNKTDMKRYNGHDVSDAVYDMLSKMSDELDMLKKDMGKKDAAIESLNSSVSETGNYKQKWATAQANVDSLKAENLTLKNDLQGKMDASEIGKEIAKRQIAWGKASQFLGEDVKLDSSDDVLTIQLKTIKAVNPDIRMDAIAKEYGDAFPIYVQAMFDGLATPTQPTHSIPKKDAYTEAIKRAQLGGDRSGSSLENPRNDAREKERLDGIEAVKRMYRTGRASA